MLLLPQDFMHPVFRILAFGFVSYFVLRIQDFFPASCPVPIMRAMPYAPCASLYTLSAFRSAFQNTAVPVGSSNLAYADAFMNTVRPPPEMLHTETAGSALNISI